MVTTLLTRDFGLLLARAEGVRRSGAKLSHALQTLSQSELILVKGKEGWRVTGALLKDDCFGTLSRDARLRASRVSGLLQRLFGKEIPDPRVYTDFLAFMEALREADEDTQDALETLMAIRLLSHLGVEASSSVPSGFGESSLAFAKENRKELIGRINRSISISGL